MLHRLTIGHFDVEALRERRLVVLRPLEMDAVARLVREFADVTEDGQARMGRWPIEFKDGYLICPWLMPRRIPAAEGFARQLVEETGCVLYDDTRREVLTPEQFEGW